MSTSDLLLSCTVDPASADVVVRSAVEVVVCTGATFVAVVLASAVIVSKAVIYVHTTRKGNDR